MARTVTRCLIALIFIVYFVHALPRRNKHVNEGNSVLGREEVRRLLEILRNNHIEHHRNQQREQQENNTGEEEEEKEETEEEINKIEEEENVETEQERKQIFSGGNIHEKRNNGQSDETHGGEKIDKYWNNPNPNDKITNLLESMVIEHGEGPEYAHQPHGIENIAAHKDKVEGDKNDRHILTHKQKVESGLESEYPDETKKRRRKRNFLTSNILWEKGIIPYEIASSLQNDASNVQTIETSINMMKELTCVQFLPRTAAEVATLNHQSYIEFFDGDGCWSYVGRVFSGKQQISLKQPWCVSVPTTIHEMCHAIGQMHEQSRSDRDNYVTMLWSNIQGGTGNNNMAKENTRDVNSYDHESVLQYSLTAFSNNGQPTMEFHDKKLNFLADSATGLMFYDVKDITDVYSCTDKCSSKPSCQNGGFVNHKCECYCPDGLTGSLCETVTTDNDCGGIIDLANLETRTIQTPNYPNNYPIGKKCNWLIRAPADKHVRLEINDLHLSDNGNACYHWLEVRYNLIGQNGPKICGIVQNENYLTSPDDEQNLMLLKFDSHYSSDRAASKGFNLTVKAVGSGCVSNPCAFGTCSDDPNGSYVCQCNQGFSGQQCDVVEASATLTCNFESTCFMQNADSGDQFDWTEQSGGTPSSGTGPSAAHGGSKYLYAEMSSPRVSGDKAVFQSYLTLPNVNRCLKFWYHMYGASVGTLNIMDNNNNVLWTKSGDQGNTWIEDSVNVPGSDGLVIKFEAVRGSSWNGDIAIDDITLAPGNCGGVTTAQPTTAQPTTAQPTTPQPTTPQPTTPQPTTPSPTTPSPTTPSPTTPSPTTPSPTTPSPTTPSPTTPSPTTASPTTPSPTTPSPTTPSPTTASPTTTQGPTTSTLICDFEDASTCFMGDEQSLDDFDWTRRTGSTPSSGTGPSSAHGGQYYLYAEMSSPRVTGDRAVFQTQTALSGVSRCLEFYYHIYGGTSVGSLNVLASGVNIWSVTGTQGDFWSQAKVDIPADIGSEVSFEAVRSSWKGDIAIDDVVLTPGVCTYPSSTSPPTIAPPPDGIYTCTFEDSDTCFLSDSSIFAWTIRSGSTPSSDTGPNQAFEGTKYAYIEASSPAKQGDVAVLQSPVLPSGSMCLSFNYHMYGDNIGDLEIFHVDNNVHNLIWSKSGNQQTNWHSDATVMTLTGNSYITIEGVVGSSYKSDIAIDNIVLSPGDCGCYSNPCKNNGACNTDGNGGYTCTCSAGFSGSDCSEIGDVDLKCTFETGDVCFLDQEGFLDDFDWTERSGSTPSSSTGPTSAIEGTMYSYIEASSPRVENDYARYVTNIVFSDGPRCLTFQYHMYGSNTGSLHVYLSGNGQETDIYSLSGDHGDVWKLGGVSIPTLQNTDVIIEAVRGNGFRSDIALDDIQLISGTCGCALNPCQNGGTCSANANTPSGVSCSCAQGFSGDSCEQIDGASLFCSFDTACFMQNTGNDDFDWQTRNTNTPSSNTGPSTLHDGYYTYIETSSPRIANDIAVLSSESVVLSRGERCLSFWYHMYGNTMGKLEVATVTLATTQTVWSMNGDQGDVWHYAEVDIPAADDLVVELIGYRGSSYTSDIAVDDLSLVDGLCANPS